MSARVKRPAKKPAAAAAAAADAKDMGDDFDEEEEDDIVPFTSKDVMQIVKRLKQDGSQTSLSKEGLELDTPEEEEKMFETLKKSPFLVYDAQEDRIKLNQSMLAVNAQNVKEKIEEFRHGVSREDLVEYDAKLMGPIREHLRNASLFALKGWKDSNKHVLMLYPRGTDFLVPLTGTFVASGNRHFLQTSVDLRNEVRRGDSLLIDGKPYRVSCEPNTLVTMSKAALREYIKSFTEREEEEDQIDLLIDKAHALTQTHEVRSAQPISLGSGGGSDISALEKLDAPYSSSSLRDTKEPAPASAAGGEKNRPKYRLDFTATMLPLDPPFRGTGGSLVEKVHKHGMTNDVRRAYMEVANQASGNFKNTRESAAKLDMLLLQEKVLSKKLLDGINHNDRELRENVEKRMLEQQKQKSARKRRA